MDVFHTYLTRHKYTYHVLRMYHLLVSNYIRIRCGKIWFFLRIRSLVVGFFIVGLRRSGDGG